MIFIIQIIILLLLLSVVCTAWIFFPYPSPMIRAFLPARKRWPESQIRNWLESGRFQNSYLKFFYRDPERKPPPGASLLAPADGLVTGVEVKEGIRYLVIALSFWDMHIQRSPMSGRVVSVDSIGDTYMDGEGREFSFLRDKVCPVQKRLVLDTDYGRIAVRLITSAAARRIQVWVAEKEKVMRGQRIGKILLGSTVVLELPAEWPISVSTGERAWAGVTEIVDSGFIMQLISR